VNQALLISSGEGPDGEAYRAFQAHVKKLTDRGVLLAVCSKNNESDAREPFQQNPQMALSLDDFAHFEASWDPKAVGLQQDATRWTRGSSSFAGSGWSPRNVMRCR
jgi:predicted enzyme involved in methoxymalonyl-ACP biosynthesis